MNNNYLVEVEMHLPQRTLNIVQKLSRLEALSEVLGSDEIAGFVKTVSNSIGVKTKSYKKLIDLLKTNEDYLLIAEKIVDDIETKYVIVTGTNLLQESLNRDNNLAWVIDYNSDQLNTWAKNKIDEIALLCKNNKSVALNSVYLCFTKECERRGKAYPDSFSIQSTLNSEYKKLLISALIKCSVGDRFAMVAA